MGSTQTRPLRPDHSELGERSPQTRALAGLLIGLFLCCGMGTLAWSATDERRPTVMLDVVDAPLTQVVRMLTQQSGANIIISSDADLSSKKVTAHVDGLPVEKVLNYLVTSAGVSYRKMDDGTYLIGVPSLDSGNEKPPVLADTGTGRSAASIEQPAAEMAAEQPKEKMVMEAIKLRYSAPGDILVALGVQPGKVNSFVTSGNVDDQHPWKPVTPGKIIGQGTPILSPGGRNAQGSVPPVPPTSDIQPSRNGEAQRGPGEYSEALQYRPSQGYGVGVPGYPGGTTTRAGTLPGQQPTTTTGTQAGLLPPDIDYVAAYDVDNSLIVRGTPKAVGDLKDLISRYLDIPPKQVSIKAEFIAVSTSDVNNFGIDWQIQTLNRSFSTAFNPAGNVTVGVATGNVTATLRAELTNGKGRIVNSPIISTLNNRPAWISIGQQIPYWQSVVQSTGDNLVTSYQLSQLTVATYLQVVPRINGDGTITMYLQPSVQDTGRMYTGPDGTQVPATQDQTLETNRRVMNGETIVLGGFIRRTDSSTDSRVPFLGRLPIIGGLFRSTQKSEDESELLIFVTPTIIPEKGGQTLGVIS